MCHLCTRFYAYNVPPCTWCAVKVRSFVQKLEKLLHFITWKVKIGLWRTSLKSDWNALVLRMSWHWSWRFLNLNWERYFYRPGLEITLMQWNWPKRHFMNRKTQMPRSRLFCTLAYSRYAEGRDGNFQIWITTLPYTLNTFFLDFFNFFVLKSHINYKNKMANYAKNEFLHSIGTVLRSVFFI